MNATVGPYQVVDFPSDRRFMANLLNLTWAGKHSMYGLLEVDVTRPRQLMRAQTERTGKALSFTGYLVLCLARAVDENTSVQAVRKGSRQLVVFENVDVGVLVERKAGDQRVLEGEVIRRANRKTLREIHDQIRAAQSTPPQASGRTSRLVQSALLLPWPLSRVMGAVTRWIMRRDPTIAAAAAGTVGINSIGMFGKGRSGWGIAPTMHPLDVIVGSMLWKPAVVANRIEPREILNLTLVFDHDVLDGAPAARFARRLAELIESGYGLASPPAPAAVPGSTGGVTA
jgi:pyruvate/2-oxoglutarate dehydrogenase complex dihydrolipoamide acyltransferase (E2) component